MTKFVAHVNYKQKHTIEALEDWNFVIKENLPEVKYVFFNTIQDLFPKLSDPNFNVDYINIEAEILQNFTILPHTLITTLKTLISSTLHRSDNGKTQKRNTKIIGIVGCHTPVELIKEMIPLVDGLCMSFNDHWSTDVVLKDQAKLASGDLSIPKEIRCLLNARKKPTVITETTIKLTPRQKQVYVLVTKRGASNKIIAKTLNISESTVKLHIGSILRKYGLRNRTQLAVFSKQD